jgi:hypothetical protein
MIRFLFCVLIAGLTSLPWKGNAATYVLSLDALVAEGRIGDRETAGAGRVDAAEPQDAYELTLADRTVIWAEDLNASACCVDWELQSANGAGVFAFNDRLNGIHPGRRSLPAGQYRVRVKSNGTPPSEGITYSFRLRTVVDDPPMPYRMGEVIRNGFVGDEAVSGAGNLRAPGQVDVYRFLLSEPARISFDEGTPEVCCVGWHLQIAGGAVRLVDRLDGTSPGPQDLSAGEYEVRVFASGGDPGWVGNYELKLRLSGPPIREQPTSVTALRNTDALFRMAAGFEGDGTYQWHHNNQPIPGATGSELRLPRVTAENAGAYHCVATDRRGSSTSRSALLIVRMNYGALVDGSLAGALSDPPQTGNGVRIDFFHAAVDAEGIEEQTPTVSLLSPVLDFPAPGAAVEPGPGYEWFFQSAVTPPPAISVLDPSGFVLRAGFHLRVTAALDLHPETEEIDLDVAMGFRGALVWDLAGAAVGKGQQAGFSERVWALSFPRPGLYPVSLVFAAAEGARAGLDLRWRVAGMARTEPITTEHLVTVPPEEPSAQAILRVQPGNLDVRVVRGEQSFVTLRWINVGNAASQPGSLELPEVPWLFALDGLDLPTLPPGASFERTLHFAPPADEPFGAFSGSLAWVAGEQSWQVPIHIRVVEDQVRDRRIRVEDELTYFTAEGRAVAGAHVRFQDAETHELLAEGTTDATGHVVLAGIPDGVHEVEVSATGHLPYRGYQTLDAGTANPVALFVPVETVQTSWSVEPATTEDRTRIVIETTFESNVPLPVVTVSPAALVLDSLPFVEGVARVFITATNSGLIAAEGVHIAVPTHPLYEVVATPTEVGTIPALGSVRVELQVRDRSWVWRRHVGVPLPVAFPEPEPGTALPVDALTRVEQIRSFAAARDAEATRRFPGPGSGRKAGPAADSVCTVQPAWQANASGCTDGSSCAALWGQYADWQLDYHQYVADATIPLYETLYGTQAADLYRHYLASTLPATTVFGPTDEVVKGSPGSAYPVHGFANSPTTTRAVEALLAAAMARNQERHDCEHLPTRIALTNLFTPDELGAFERMLNFDRFDNDISAFLAGGGKRANGAGGSASLGRCDDRRFEGDVLLTTRPTACEGVLEVVLEYVGQLTILDSIDFCPGNILNRLAVAGTEVNLGQFLGLDSMQILEANCRATAVPFVAVFTPEVPPASFFLRCAEDCCDLAVSATHCYRCGGFNICRSVPVTLSASGACPPGGAGGTVEDSGSGGSGSGGGGSRGGWSRHATSATPCRTTPGGSAGTAAERPAARPAADVEGVCASVRLRLDQEFVSTRDLFQAQLEIVNSTLNDLVGVEVQLEVRTAHQEPASDHFRIVRLDPQGLGVPEGDSVLAAGDRARLAWQIVPLVSAAPSEARGYWVGGWLRYTSSAGRIELPLSPAFIRVQPSPSIVARYFHQRDVHADDPFTDVVEASEPFSLGVQVVNRGPGTVRNLRLNSGVPVITDNDKGLFARFALVDATLDGELIPSTLGASLGSLAPGSQRIVHWRFLGSVQGVFSAFSARYENRDIAGRVGPPTFESLSTHELTRAVRVRGQRPGGSPDFLVNDVADERNTPDHLYLSGGTIEPVTALDVEPPADLGPTPDLQSLVSPAVAGWVYRRVVLEGTAERRLKGIVRSDGTVLDPDAQTWVTRRTFRALGEPAVAERVLHIVDHDGPGSYTLAWEAPDETPIATEDVVRVSSLERVRISIPVLLSNDRDPEGHALHWVSVDPVSQGGAMMEVRDSWIVYAGSTVSGVGDEFGYSIRDAAGNVARGVVRLVVERPEDPGLHRILGPAVTGDRVVLEYVGIPGRSYRLQSTTRLGSGVWTDVGREITDRTGRLRWTLPVPGTGEAFYRAVAE